MGRPSKPFFRTQTQSWYVTNDGKKVNLGKDKDAAFTEWHRLKSAPDAMQTETKDRTVLEVLDEFLDWCKKHNASETYDWYFKRVAGFSTWLEKKGMSALKVTALKPFHLTRYADDSYKPDKLTSIRNCIRACQRPFHWAKGQGYIEANPVEKVEKPEVQTRDYYITAEQWDETFAAARAKSPFQDLLVFLRYTGCRPQEVKKVEARHFDRANRCMVLDRKQSKGKKKQRVILLSHPKVLEVVERRVKAHPTGPIFLNTDGNAWTNTAICSAVERLKQKLGYRLPPYAFRHAFVTDMLEAGMDPVELSEITGHRDLTMIMRVYNHLSLKRQHLHDRLQATLEKLEAKAKPAQDLALTTAGA